MADTADADRPEHRDNPQANPVALIAMDAQNVAPRPPPAPPVLQHVPFPEKLELQDDPAKRKTAWTAFAQVWKNYEISSQLDEHPKGRRTATLLTCFSSSALKVFNSLSFESEAQKKDIDVILTKMTEACEGTVNTTYERYLFNTRTQGPSECIDNFYSELKEMARNCDFGDLADSLIRDRLVVGLRDAATRKRLLYEKKLTLQTCLEIARSFEATQARLKEMKSEPADVDFVKKSPRKRNTNKPSKQKAHTHPPEKKSESSSSCTYCGKGNHPRKKCPANNAECFKCKKRGHFSTVCKSTKTAHLVEQEELPDGEEFFLGAISDGSTQSWTKAICVDDSEIVFKVDTGADVSVLPYSVYRKSLSDKPIFPVNSKLRGPCGNNLEVLGAIKCKLSYNGTQITTELYVVKASTALLSREDSVRLKIVQLIGSVESYSELFKGLGTMPDPYKIKLREGAKPFAVTTPRRISLPLMPKVKNELERLEKLEIIRKVEEPTPWCAPIVPVPKPNGQVRLCVDYKKLNESVERELHMLPSVDQVLGQMGEAKVFSKLDANSGFHQIKLAPESQLLTTFISPYGRYCYQRLPFGINSAPEHYQKQVQKIIGDLQGVACLMDDIVVYGRTLEEHNERLDKCLQKLSAAGITLNRSKCSFHQEEIVFLGHVVGQHGIKAHAAKTTAIQEMEEPTDLKSLRRFLGMVNQMGKFLPHLADVTEPLRSLLSPKTEWIWESQQRNAVKKIKNMLAATPILAPYDHQRPTKVSADSSSYGLGAVLLQKSDDTWKPVAYASRSLSETEKRYAQVEKEALAAVWACSKFQDYLYGITFVLETDHQPLVALFGHKTLDEIPPRIQRMRMRMMRFSYDIVHVPGKDLHTADTLSRAPLSVPPTKDDIELENDVTCFIAEVLHALPITDSRLEEVRQHQAEDHACRLLSMYIEEGWPDKNSVSGTMGMYFQHQAHLSKEAGIILYDGRLLIPSSLRQTILDRIHTGHQGITKCRMRARQSVWWPGISREIEDIVRNCKSCAKEKCNAAEPLIPTPTPEYPWQKIASDLFEYQKKQFLLVVDYYSRFIEVVELKTTTSTDVITELKRIFARFGIPQCMISDNGPQYSSEEFKHFTHEWGIVHVTSSPGHPSANGEAERAVRTIKELWKPSSDPYSALLAYHSTPLASGYSPGELLMNRRIRSQVPMTNNALKSAQPNLDFERKDEQRKVHSMLHFNAKATPLPVLPAGQEVWLKDRSQEGVIEKQLTPRSYVVKTPTGTYRRNRRMINELPTSATTQTPRSTATKPRSDSIPASPPKALTSTPSTNSPPRAGTPQKTSSAEKPSTPAITTRSGRIVKIPGRYKDQ
jgi:transposase InsO family protein